MTQADIELLRRVFRGQWTANLVGRSLKLSLDATELTDEEVQTAATDLIAKVKELIEENARLKEQLKIRGQSNG